MDTQKKVIELFSAISDLPSDIEAGSLNLLTTVERWVENEGKSGIHRAKALFDWLLKFHMEGEIPPPPQWIKINKKGIPVLLEYMFPWCLTNVKNSLSLVRIHELFVIPADDEECLQALHTVEASPIPVWEQWKPLMSKVTRDLTLDKLVSSYGANPLFTRGPNGISILSVHKDIPCLNYHGLTPKIESLINRISETSPDMKMSEVTQELISEFSEVSENGSVAKIVFLNEKSGKLRLIAQGDYLSQSALKPIHDSLMKVLGNIPNDFVMDQSSGKDLARRFTQHGYCVSYDLSSATDTLSVKAQSYLIDLVLPGNLGKDWEAVLDRPFSYTLPSGKTGMAKYSAGQPMGFLSSFPAFTLLHHVVVRLAYYKAYNKVPHKSKRFYAIIGDDIVIGDKDVSREYLKIVKDFGGNVNLSKSWISDNPNRSYSEFAKSWSVDGVDITPTSLRMFRTSLNSWSEFPVSISRHWENTQQFTSRKKMLTIFQRFFAKEAKILVDLLPIPPFLGGFGKRDHIPMRDRIDSVAIRLFIANRILSCFTTITSHDSVDVVESVSDISDPRAKRLALSLYTKLLRDKQGRWYQLIRHNRKSFLVWATSNDTPMSLLIDMLEGLNKELTFSLRDTLPTKSLGWIRSQNLRRKEYAYLPQNQVNIDFAIDALKSVLDSNR